MKLLRRLSLFLFLSTLLCACTAEQPPEQTLPADQTLPDEETGQAGKTDLKVFSIDLSGSAYPTMSKHAVGTVGRETVNTVKKEIFGDNLAWRGSGYGVWDPVTKQLNGKLVDAIRACGVTTLRYPGGTEGDYFHWQETVGNDRKKQVDPFSNSYPTNATKKGVAYDPDFGLDEFLLLCEAAGVEPVIQLNAGDGTPEEAAALIRYCIDKGCSVSSFAIGNEVNMKGESIAGLTVSKTPEQYIAFAKKVYEELGDLADSVELGVIGLVEDHALNAYPEWDRKILSTLGDKIDFIDCHMAYAPYFTSNTDSEQDILRCYMAAPDYIRGLIRETKNEILTYSKDNSDHISIQITEYGPMGTYYNGTVGSVFLATLLQEMLAEPMISSANHLPMLNHPVAANLVGYAPASYTGDGAEHFWDNTSTFVFRWYAEQIGRDVLKTELTSSTFSSKKIGLIPFIPNASSASMAAYFDQEQNKGTLFLINRSTTQNQAFDVTLPFGGIRITAVTELYSDDPTAANSWKDPYAVTPRSYRVDAKAVRDSAVSAVLKPISVLKIDFEAAES